MISLLVKEDMLVLDMLSLESLPISNAVTDPVGESDQVFKVICLYLVVSGKKVVKVL